MANDDNGLEGARILDRVAPPRRRYAQKLNFTFAASRVLVSKFRSCRAIDPRDDGKVPYRLRLQPGDLLHLYAGGWRSPDQDKIGVAEVTALYKFSGNEIPDDEAMAAVTASPIPEETWLQFAAGDGFIELDADGGKEKADWCSFVRFFKHHATGGKQFLCIVFRQHEVE